MIRSVRTLVAVAVLSARAAVPLAAQGPAPAKSTADVAAHATPATATVIAIDATGDTLGQGSAFLLRADGVVITNYHVLRGASNAIVVLASGERFTRVRVLDADSALDLAIVKIPGAGLPTLPVRTTIPRAGEKVVAIGSPLGLSETVTEGIVSASRVVDGRELVQISAAISPGSSGGAVLDERGNVFAVSTSYLRGGQSLNFAVPVRYAVGLINDHAPERSVAEVFATGPVASRDGSRATSASSSASSHPSELPPGWRRTPTPRADMSGSYAVTTIWSTSGGKTDFEQQGMLFATPEVGYLALAVKKDSTHYDDVQVFRVVRWSTNSAGDLVLGVSGDISFDGYQTDDNGFALHTTMTLKDGLRPSVLMGGVPSRLPLSNSDGLYTARVRTGYYTAKGERFGDPTDWTGDLAVVVARDTIHASLVLHNDGGGSVGFSGLGKLTDGTFSLSNDQGKRLSGTLRSGVLTATWTDVRDGGTSFRGTLTAERR